MSENGRYKLNKELAQMLKGGVIMDVTTPEQAKIAEAAGACAVMALERIPADIRAAGGVSRMRVKCYRRRMMFTILTRGNSKCHSYVEQEILEKHFGGLMKVRQ